MFPGKVHQKILDRKEKEPNEKVLVRHVVIRSENYSRKFNQPWTSIFIDCENECIMEERGSVTRIYVIPRWMTIPGSQYAYSPATLIAVPDARLIQAMTLTLLEAGEKAVNPPMVGVGEAIDGDLSIYAGGFTSIDSEYDERLGEVLRPLTVDKSGIGYGMEMLDRNAMQIREAFYLNTLSMPPQGGPEMTAFEVGQRVQEYIRNALPLFEPMEAEYNGELCDMTFETLLNEGAFGPLDKIPESIAGSEITFDFESPLNEMLERKKGQTFLEAKAMVTETMAVDPSAVYTIDWKETLRDVLGGIGAPEKWLRSKEEAEQDAEADRMKAEAAQMLEGMKAASDVTANLGPAAEQFAG